MTFKELSKEIKSVFTRTGALLPVAYGEDTVAYLSRNHLIVAYLADAKEYRVTAGIDDKTSLGGSGQNLREAAMALAEAAQKELAKYRAFSESITASIKKGE